MENVAEHPSIQGYGADREGNVYNLTRKRRLHGSVRGGYRRVGVADRAHSEHVFVWTCFNGQPGKGYEVHHKNSDKLDNRLCNLDVVEAAVHRRLTAAETVVSGKSMLCHSRRRPVKRVHHDGREELFNGVEEAARAAGVCTSTVTQSAKSTSSKRYKKAHWQYTDTIDEEGEVWACPRPSQYKGLCVSNLGRVKSKYGVVSRGYAVEDGYMKVRVNNKSYGVHSIVNQTFNGFPSEPGMTTEHVDRDRSNNRANNLRWCTRYGQSHNSSRANSVTATCVMTGVTKTWPSARLAAEDTVGSDRCQIGKACVTGKEYKRCLWSR